MHRLPRRLLSALLLCAVLLLAAAPGCAARPSLKRCPVLHEEEFGGAYICCTIDDFNALGFVYGDSVRVEFSNGYVLDGVPYYNGYYTANGEPLLVAYPGYPWIKAGINNGDDLWTVAGLSEGDTAEISLVERGAFAAVQDARDIHYSDFRSDYDSDEEFANFRPVRAGDILEGMLYRSASPCDDQHGRAPYVDALIRQAGVGFILDLADNDGKIQGYLSDPGFSSPYFLSLYEAGAVEPIALNMNYGSADFRSRVAAGLSVMAESEGPYLVHCTEGKDRTGFVCVLLEALCGADYEEIERDYMITYENYYDVGPGSARYDVIVENVLVPMVQSLAGDPEVEVRKIDLAECAEQFLLDGGMSPDGISLLRARLVGFRLMKNPN